MHESQSFSISQGEFSDRGFSLLLAQLATCASYVGCNNQVTCNDGQ